jgi:hypothetical protein
MFAILKDAILMFWRGILQNASSAIFLQLLRITLSVPLREAYKRLSFSMIRGIRVRGDLKHEFASKFEFEHRNRAQNGVASEFFIFSTV